MAKYASNTRVPVSRSKAEIESILQRYNATAYGHFQDSDKALVQFKMEGRSFQIAMPLPPLDDFKVTGSRRKRSDNAAMELREKEIRRRWRAVCLVLKAKLELIECGISSVDAEFFPYLVLPGGGTIQDVLLPHMDALAQGCAKLLTHEQER